MVWTRSWSRGCGMSVHMEPSWHGVNSQPQLLQLLCKPVLKDNPCPSDCVTDKTDDGHGEGTTLREGWILCNPQEQRNLGCSRPHRTVQECPLCQLIPGMWHFWNCLCQDFLLWHLWFLRLPHRRKPQISCSSLQGFLYPATLLSSLDTKTRWKGLNVSLAR